MTLLLWDQDEAQVAKAVSHIAATLPLMADEGLIEDAAVVQARIRAARDLGDALDGAGFVQENIVERAEPKQKLFAEVEAHA
jgi:L-gulonate 3-dehydrogenase